MAIRIIRTEEDPILRKISRPVTKFDEKLWTILDDMRDTMQKANGVGLAAVQVGLLRRAVIIDVDDGSGVIELINPEIVEYAGEQEGQEGCLSLPGESGCVRRPMKGRLSDARTTSGSVRKTATALGALWKARGSRHERFATRSIIWTGTCSLTGWKNS